MLFVRAGVWSLAIVVLSICAFAQGEPKKVSRSEALAAVLSKVQPDYPTIAKQLNLHGTTEMEALVSEDGLVEKVNIVSGNPVLTKPSAEALKKWKFRPFLSDGKPAKALVSVTFDFAM